MIGWIVQERKGTSSITFCTSGEYVRISLAASSTDVSSSLVDMISQFEPISCNWVRMRLHGFSGQPRHFQLIYILNSAHTERAKTWTMENSVLSRITWIMLSSVSRFFRPTAVANKHFVYLYLSTGSRNSADYIQSGPDFLKMQNLRECLGNNF